ncbi:SDR family oxidoreductase [Pseudonocardia sp. MCCB 268]|nr:SDR family oxidoreductase [Pseudonocardia cytotoxica]
MNHEAAVRLHDSLDALGVERFVFTSTCSNYGIHDTSSFADETSDLNPRSLYAETKIAVEQRIAGRAERTVTTGTVLRGMATAYGLSPRGRFDLTISQFTRDLAAGASCSHDADTWRPYCHDQDLSTAILSVLGAPRELVHGGSSTSATRTSSSPNGWSWTSAETSPTPGVGYRDEATDPRNYRVSFAKISSALGFRTRHTVQDYVAALVSAVQAGVFTDVEVGDVRCNTPSGTWIEPAVGGHLPPTARSASAARVAATSAGFFVHPRRSGATEWTTASTAASPAAEQASSAYRSPRPRPYPLQADRRCGSSGKADGVAGYTSIPSQGSALVHDRGVPRILAPVVDAPVEQAGIAEGLVEKPASSGSRAGSSRSAISE